jgi:hypothetical protein
MSDETLLYENPKDVEEYIGGEIGRGNDYIVFELSPGLVAKRPNFEDSGEERQHDFSQTEYYETLVSDSHKLKAIFGDNFEPTYLYPANDFRNFILVQKRFHPEQFLSQQLIEKKPEEIGQFITENREQFSAIVFAAKKALIEFGYPVDIQLSNLVLDNGKIVFIETDCPTYRANKLYKEGGYKNKAKRELLRLKYYEQLLGLSGDEIAELNSRYRINPSKYDAVYNKVFEASNQT